MRKTKFRWLALLLATVALFGVLAIPASADYYYAMKVSVYYKDESGKTLAPTYTTTVNATTTTPAVSGYLLKNDNDASVPYSRMEKRFPASNYVREGSASYTVYYVKASTVCISYAYFDRSGRPSESKMLTGKVGSSYSVVSPTITGFTPSVSCVTGTFQDTSAGKTVYYYENTYQISYDANGGSGAPGSQTKTENVTLTLSPVSPRRTGYGSDAFQSHAYPFRLYLQRMEYRPERKGGLCAGRCTERKRQSDSVCGLERKDLYGFL